MCPRPLSCLSPSRTGRVHVLSRAPYGQTYPHRTLLITHGHHGHSLDVHLGRRPMNDHVLPLARMSRWKWLGRLGYSCSPVWRVWVLSCWLWSFVYQAILALESSVGGTEVHIHLSSLKIRLFPSIPLFKFDLYTAHVLHMSSLSLTFRLCAFQWRYPLSYNSSSHVS